MHGGRLLPGLALVGAVATLGMVGASHRGGTVAGDPLVLALLIGMAIRSLARLPEATAVGIEFAGTRLLEVAVVLLGVGVDLPLLLRAGPKLLVGIVGVVVLALGMGYAIGRAVGLPPRLALLVATGNAICGNSAIAAVTPVIGASREDVVSAIAGTALLGVPMVLALPYLAGPLDMNEYQFGVVVGLTVYAVPQVLAAAMPVGTVAAQVGTLVKLVRVLLLGPIIIGIAAWQRRTRRSAIMSARRVTPQDTGDSAVAPSRLLPWFLTGFLLLGACRSLGLLPARVADPLRWIASQLTLLAMAALGLGVDIRRLRTIGPRLLLAVTGALLLLATLGTLLARWGITA